MLAVRQLRKSYGSLRAVDGVSFAVRRGELLGLLGPNDAGKTTTVSMIAGVVSADAGEVAIAWRVFAGKKRKGLDAL
jgi:ABC-type multidrug transport system ATPase subunit